MKILWLSHLVPYPPKGGVLQRSYNLIKEVSKDHEITLFAFNQRDFLKGSLPGLSDPLDFACTELRKLVKEIKVFDIPENQSPGGKYWVAFKAILLGSSYNMEWLKSISFRRELISLLEHKKFDVIHVDTISLCVYMKYIGKTPVILNHHNFESKMLLERSRRESNLLKRIFYFNEARSLFKSEKKFIKESNLNITCSDQDSGDIKDIVNVENVIAIPNGVDLSYFSTNRDSQPLKNRLILVGGLSWYPNRDAVEYFLSEVWPLLKVRIPSVHVDIIGRNPSEMIKKSAELEPRIHVHGFVDDIREYLWRSEFYLCPIRIGGGTKLKILDALASGCCIIAHPFACKGIEVREGEHVLFAISAEEYVQQIEFLIARPDVCEKLRTEGPKLVEALYGYDAIGKRYSLVINETAGLTNRQGESVDELVFGKSSF